MMKQLFCPRAKSGVAKQIMDEESRALYIHISPYYYIDNWLLSLAASGTSRCLKMPQTPQLREF